MANISVTSVPPKRLAASITAASTSFQLNNILGWDGVALTSADLGTKAYGAFMNPSRTLLEFFEYDPTTIASASITMTLRGLKFDGNLSTEVSGNKLDWIKDQTIVLLGTDVSQILKQFVDLLANQTVGGVKTFSLSPLVPTPTSSELTAAASVEYVNSVAVAGAPNASTVVKGIVEEATAGELIAGTGAGATGARLFVNPTLYATSGVSKALLSKTDGKIDDSLIALTTAGDLPYSDGTDLQRLALGSAGKYLHVNSAGTAPEWARPDGQFGGTGADGALAINSGTTTLDINSANVLVKNYTSITIDGTGALAFSNPANDGSIIILRSLGNVTITSGAARAIDLRSIGGLHGAAATAGTSSYEIVLGDVSRGGAGVNQSAVDPVNGGAIYTGTKLYTSSANHLYRKYVLVSPGSGAGGGGAGVTGAGGAGGRGAGAIIIECGGALNITGTIDASGATGTAGATGAGVNSAGAGGGGGAGGSIVILYRTLTANTGTYTVTGGNGGAGGANGAGSTGGSGGGGGGSLIGAGGKGGIGSISGSAAATAGANATGTGGGTGGTITGGNNGNGGGGGGGAGGWSLVASASTLL